MKVFNNFQHSVSLSRLLCEFMIVISMMKANITDNAIKLLILFNTFNM